MHDYAAESLADTLIRKHEGTRLKLYECPAGFWTIGTGRNLESNGISNDEADLMLANDITICVDDLKNFHWYGDLSARRKAALIDLRFCVGGAGIRRFKKMIAALEAKDWAEAGRQIVDSAMAQATPGGMARCKELQKLMEEG
jgi:lysozyme